MGRPANGVSRSKQLQCLNCSAVFSLAFSDIALGRGKFCSRRCYDESESKQRVIRFWRSVEKSSDGCWLWVGPINRGGYGMAGNLTAHRLSWSISNGIIPKGLWVLHRCDNPPCVNPEHLFLGDARANNADCKQKGRVRHGERHPTAKLTSTQVMEIKEAHGSTGETHRSLAKKYGVNHTTIGDILRGQNWHRVASRREAMSQSRLGRMGQLVKDEA